tara:strand:+ start:302 stop:928 length:627 start_codon:yes stop_codon:yes gene_type:complete
MTTYPVTMPTTVAPRETNWRIQRLVGATQSIYTGSMQVYQYSGEWWECDITMPPMRTANAREFVAFLVSLRGQYGSVYIGDWDARTALGTAGTSAGTPLVNGADQTGNTLICDGAPASKTGYLKAGDYIQIGSGTDQKLHMVTADSNSDGSGNFTLSIEPALRSSPANNTALVVANTKGVFRLANSVTEWNANAVSTYGVSFSIREKL